MDGCLFRGVVTGSGTVDLRDEPGTNFDIVGKFGGGSELMFIRRNEAGDWLRVSTPEAEAIEAWIAAFLLKTDAQLNDLPVME